MIAFGICISDRAKYERVVRPCLDRCIEPNSRVIELEHQTSIFDAYNRILVAAASDPDLEGLVLLHDDLEILDHEICERLRVLFRDRSIAVAGVIGARNPRTLAWWHYETLGYVRERHLPSGVVTENRGSPAAVLTTSTRLTGSSWHCRLWRCEASDSTPGVPRFRRL